MSVWRWCWDGYIWISRAGVCKNIGSPEPPTSSKLDHLVDRVRRDRKGVRIPVCLFNPSWASTSRNPSSEIIHRCTWMWSIDSLAILFKIKRKKLEATYIFIRKGEWWPNELCYICVYIYIYPLEYQGAITREWVKWTSLKESPRHILTEKGRSGRKRVLFYFS